jgi:toxin FitB
MTEAIARRPGALAGQRQLMGRPFHVPDARIAATALEHGLTIFTRNSKDFGGIGTTSLNPWASR